MTDLIEAFIKQQLEQAGGVMEIGRNELASVFNCVPSQINYVITTRFSPQNGYVTESRRGGGGYVRIQKIQLTESNPLMHMIYNVGDSLSVNDLRFMVQNLADYEYISRREAKMILGALSDASLGVPQPLRDQLRARILKNMLFGIAVKEES